MNTILIVFYNRDYSKPDYLNSYSDKYAAERAAAAYLEDHPDDAVHLYRWEIGFTATRKVDIEKEWAWPEIPPMPALPEALAADPLCAELISEVEKTAL